MSICPTCSSRLLRHFAKGRIYSYCQACRQEMPDFSCSSRLNKHQKESLELLFESSLTETILHRDLYYRSSQLLENLSTNSTSVDVIP